MATILNKGNGKWKVTISGGYKPDGSQIRVIRTIRVNPEATLKSQQKQVEREAAALETDYRRHLITESKKMKLSEVIDEFLTHHKMAASTKTWYISLFKRILPALGKVPIQDLTPRQIRDFFASLKKETAKTARSKTGKLSGETQAHHYRALSSVIGFALKSGYIAANPMMAVDRPISDTPESKHLEGREIAAIMNVFENYPEPMWAALFILELYSSCRPGEIIGLNWSDLEGVTLHIRAGANRIGGKTIRTAKPKTKASERSIILPQKVMKPLLKWRKVQLEKKKYIGECWPKESYDAMFTGEEGNRLDLSSPTQKWRKIQKKYGLADAPLYSYRHSGASLLIAAGCDVKEVSAWLGHSRASTTLDIYSHLFEKAAQHTANTMTAAIDNAMQSEKINLNENGVTLE